MCFKGGQKKPYNFAEGIVTVRIKEPLLHPAGALVSSSGQDLGNPIRWQSFIEWLNTRCQPFPANEIICIWRTAPDLYIISCRVFAPHDLAGPRRPGGPEPSKCSHVSFCMLNWTDILTPRRVWGLNGLRQSQRGEQRVTNHHNTGKHTQRERWSHEVYREARSSRRTLEKGWEENRYKQRE